MRVTFLARNNKRAGSWSTKGCRERLIKRGIDPDKITITPNGLLMTVEHPDRTILDKAIRALEIYAGYKFKKLYEK